MPPPHLRVCSGCDHIRMSHILINPGGEPAEYWCRLCRDICVDPLWESRFISPPLGRERVERARSHLFSRSRLSGKPLDEVP